MLARHLLRLSISIVVSIAIICSSSTVFGKGAPALPAPSASALSEAKSIAWSFRYSPDYSAHTNGAHICGKLITLAMGCYAGDSSADYRFVQQMRSVLGGSNCIVAAGGYGAQHERLFTGSAVIAREIPRVWNQFTEDEKTKIDLLMKAALVASAYTTSDEGARDGQNTDMRGGTNLGRGWNPNFREGMIGMMFVGSAWFGSGQAAEDFLSDYDHDAFKIQLALAGLTNTYETFNYRVDHPTSGAPTAYMIEKDIHEYRYYEMTLDEMMDIYAHLTLGTYDRNVNTGLYGGVGINGYGKMYSGQAGLPNLGAFGMLHEFDGTDAGGLRSSVGYAYDGFRPNMVNQLVLLTTANWEDGDLADSCIDRMRIGVPDLFYKLQYGYLDYSKGHSGATIFMTDEGRDFYMTKSVWYDVVMAYHDGLVTCADAGSDIVVMDNDGNGEETVSLDGSASIAAPGESVTAYLWTDDSGFFDTNANCQITLPVGTHELRLTITDSSGRTSYDKIKVLVDQPPLFANAGGDQTVTADAQTNTALVSLDGSGSNSKDGTIFLYEWKLNGASFAYDMMTTKELGVGQHTITLVVYDSLQQTASTDITVTVEPEQTTVPGDCDGDGDVDIFDFLILKANYGTPSGATLSTGDCDGDGDVDIYDFLILKANYGH